VSRRGAGEVARKELKMWIEALNKEYEEVQLRDENEKLDFESKLLFLIMRGAARTGFDEVLPFDRFIKKYKTELKDTMQVFEWLGLAKRDKAAPLGWRATIRLQYALMLRGHYPEEVQRMNTSEEFRLFETIYKAALGRDVDEEDYSFLTRQLVGLSLAQSYQDEYYVPTPQLRRLVYKAKARHSLKAG
jgi:hypothetical protein